MVWFWVPLATPATSHPLPGSPFQSPTASSTTKEVSSPCTSMKPSSPLDKKFMVSSATAKMAGSALPWATMYTSPGATVAPSANAFQYSYSPTTLGALLTLG